MSESGDDKLREAYGALARVEPGAALDAAILAASRRALAKPSGARRWAAPVSIAAVLVLAFGVTLHMQEEKPGVESPGAYAPPPQDAAQPAPPKTVEAAPEPRAQPQRVARPQPQKKSALPAAKPDVAKDIAVPAPQAKLQAAPAQAQVFEDDSRQRRDEARVESEEKQKENLLQKQAKVAEAPPAPAAPAAAAPSRMKREAFAASSAASAGAVSAQAQAAVDEPTRELEAIAKLRAEGRSEEADKALAEFRRKRPDYRISEPMWERVKPR